MVSQQPCTQTQPWTGASLRTLPGGSIAPGSAPVVSLEPPRRLTEGLPCPQSIEKQKQAYLKTLDAQLHQGTQAIVEQTRVKKEMLTQAVQSQKKQYKLQIEQRLRLQEMEVDQQLNTQVMGLQHAALEEKAKLDRQASALKMEYEQRKLQEDILAKQYQLQRHQYDMQMRVPQG